MRFEQHLDAINHRSGSEVGDSGLEGVTPTRGGLRAGHLDCKYALQRHAALRQ